MIDKVAAAARSFSNLLAEGSSEHGFLPCVRPLVSCLFLAMTTTMFEKVDPLKDLCEACRARWFVERCAQVLDSMAAKEKK